MYSSRNNLVKEEASVLWSFQRSQGKTLPKKVASPKLGGDLVRVSYSSPKFYVLFLPSLLLVFVSFVFLSLIQVLQYGLRRFWSGPGSWYGRATQAATVPVVLDGRCPFSRTYRRSLKFLEDLGFLATRYGQTVQSRDMSRDRTAPRRRTSSSFTTVLMVVKPSGNFRFVPSASKKNLGNKIGNGRYGWAKSVCDRTVSRGRPICPVLCSFSRFFC